LILNGCDASSESHALKGAASCACVVRASECCPVVESPLSVDWTSARGLSVWWECSFHHLAFFFGVLPARGRGKSFGRLNAESLPNMWEPKADALAQDFGLPQSSFFHRSFHIVVQRLWKHQREDYRFWFHGRHLVSPVLIFQVILKQKKRMSGNHSEYGW
jgi:hypothetical protein